jgi:cyclohexa-1,5-dienecarbonyl-CoA hydratase
MEKQYETIRFSVEENVAFISLDHPPINIMNIQMMEEICDALTAVSKDKNLLALVIKAEGKVFSGGVSVEDHMGDLAEPMLHLFHKMFHIMSGDLCPTIAVVEGAAIGGGSELATFCDIVYATDNAKLGQPEINLGLFPPVTAVTFPTLTGFNRTMELMLTGETISAQKAYEWGLFNKVVAKEDMAEEVDKLLTNLKQKSPIALRLTRKAVREAMAESFSASISKVEQIYFRELIVSDDAQEGLHSFVEKRKPVWKNS